ncbi:MAG: sulfur globule family protein, partial [Chloroflexi bacterium]|nr:sulfur globule family protein [Chloroflexota bacterium]
MGRSVTRALKRFAAPAAISLLALSLACAPVTRTVHVTSDKSASADRREFVVHVDPTAFDSNSEVRAKLESVSDGQKFARDLSKNNIEHGSGQKTFDLDLGDRAITFDMQSEVLASVASDLGIIAELADGGLILASAGNLAGGSGAGSAPQAFDPSVSISSLASISTGNNTTFGNQTTMRQAPNDVVVSGISTFSGAIAIVSTTSGDQGSPGYDEAGSNSAADSGDSAGSDDSDLNSIGNDITFATLETDSSDSPDTTDSDAPDSEMDSGSEALAFAFPEGEPLVFAFDESLPGDSDNPDNNENRASRSNDDGNGNGSNKGNGNSNGNSQDDEPETAVEEATVPAIPATDDESETTNLDESIDDSAPGKSDKGSGKSKSDDEDDDKGKGKKKGDSSESQSDSEDDESDDEPVVDDKSDDEDDDKGKGKEKGDSSGDGTETSIVGIIVGNSGNTIYSGNNEDGTTSFKFGSDGKGKGNNRGKGNNSGKGKENGNGDTSVDEVGDDLT